MQDSQVISTIKKVLPAVVSVVIAKHLEDVKTPKVPDEFVDAHGMVKVGSGSGFVVSEDGVILTNKHVVGDAEAEYAVGTNDGATYPAEVLSRDPINDVAILKIAAKGVPTIPLGDSAKLELGESVIAIGNALGLFKNTVSLGIVSGLSRAISAQENPKGTFREMRGLIQTDAAINPGNSGGPLVDLEGKAVGVNVAIVFGAQNINFAIPINAARRDLEDVKKYGRVRRPHLGIRYLLVDNDLEEKLGLAAPYGALIAREAPHDYAIVPGSPADKAGLKENDIILEIDGKKVDLDHAIQDLLENLEVGKEVELLVQRGKEQFKVKMALAERK